MKLHFFSFQITVPVATTALL